MCNEKFRGKIVKISGSLLTIMLIPENRLKRIAEYWTIPDDYENINLVKDK